MKFRLNNFISNEYGDVKSKTEITFELALFVKKNFNEFLFKYYNINQKIYNKSRPPPII